MWAKDTHGRTVPVDKYSCGNYGDGSGYDDGSGDFGLRLGSFSVEPLASSVLGQVATIPACGVAPFPGLAWLCAPLG